MPAVPRYHGAELPVYAVGTPLVEASQLADLPPAAGPTHLRPAMLRVLSEEKAMPGLGEVLEHADVELEYFARLCGVSVVRHVWGLYAVDAHSPDWMAQYLPPDEALAKTPKDMPEGHILVAEVDVIREPRGIQYHSPDAIRINRQKQAYNRERQAAGQPCSLYDMGHGQVLDGVNARLAVNGDTSRQHWLADIEPKVFWH